MQRECINQYYARVASVKTHHHTFTA